LIAHKQVQRVNAHASKPNRFVIADTTAFMTAVYSEMMFNDASLYDFAAAHQRSYDVTLVTGLDLPWVADGIQRDGPHARERTDSLLRAALNRASVPYRVVYGTGRARLENALRAIDTIVLIANYSIRTSEKYNISRQTKPETDAQAHSAVWTWPCEKCSDPDCEHRLFSQLLS
jgi:nicotinamide riboside kinase